MYDWDFSVVFRHKWVFVQGAWIALAVTFFAIILGTAAGFLLGLGRAAKPRWIRVPVSVYVEIFLAIPILVLLIWIYYCGPLLIGLRLSGFWAAVMALSLSLSAFVAEIVRSSLMAVPHGHIEAARALGMTRIQTLRKIVLPQSVRVMVPPLLSMYIATLKMSSLASVVAVYELLHSAQNLIMSSFRPLEIYTTVAVIYMVMVLPFSLLTRRFESAQKWRLS
jgi:polar amino acid transport system permease protein